ncbi:hypothetical protein CA54_35570 [Symmachiella macrocystis]|uniref:Uncharacterized protein n=1 Tax=Symmachiella macrocystis TaxID=2527985 RepID=A0A5C6BRK9_9PLAN|nr:hypothetical protein [Symmachiella macrocystis]TWU14688.1 hypothetical protein CA54_35570 [Symmachiella macrocystis]
MGYDIHITPNDEWSEEEVSGGISFEEWSDYVAADDTMRMDNEAEVRTPHGDVIRYENKGLAVWTAYSGYDESGIKAWFDFREGRISVKNPDDEILRKMYQIASSMDAKVLGDDGEEYGPDGETLDPKDEVLHTHQKPWWKFW